MMGVIQVVVQIATLLLIYVMYSICRMDQKARRVETGEIQKQTVYIAELLRWHQMENRCEGITAFLQGKKINALSIYGAGEVGKFLVQNLNRAFTIQAVLDKNPRNAGELPGNKKVDVPNKRDDYGEAILIAILHDADRHAKDELEKLGITTPIYTLRDIIAQSFVNKQYIHTP